jgi:hypothetical protein
VEGESSILKPPEKGDNYLSRKINTASGKDCIKLLDIGYLKKSRIFITVGHRPAERDSFRKVL